MNTKKYLVTGKGFIKSIVSERDPENPRELKTTIEYTNKIREAMVFPTTKSINKTIEYHNLEGFAWTPFAEEPVRDQYQVVKTDRLAIGEHELLHGFKIEKVWGAKSDAAFLSSTGAYRSMPFYDEKTARKIAIEGNKRLRELLDKLIEFDSKNTDPI